MELARKPCVPDDGKQWTLIKRVEDIDPFAGKFVACRSNSAWMRDAYKIDPESETGYVLVSMRIPLFTPLYGRYSVLYKVKSDHLDRSSESFCLSDVKTQNRSWFVRLLTLQEARNVSTVIGRGPHFLDFYHPEVAFSFRLGNLLEEEYRKYFWNRARKKVWPLQRLMHIGRKESGSGFHGVPRDIVRLIARQVIDQEANKLMKMRHCEDPLVLE
jgi:hypothetical protein